MKVFFHSYPDYENILWGTVPNMKFEKVFELPKNIGVRKTFNKPCGLSFMERLNQDIQSIMVLMC